MRDRAHQQRLQGLKPESRRDDSNLQAQTMSKRATTLIAISIAICSGAAQAAPIWTEAEHSAFVAGCALGIIVPARRDYAAAAEKAGNKNPKPFPEEELRASVEPMCGCLANRIADSGMSYLDAGNAMKPMIEEAISGGRCKPGGLLGQMLSKYQPGSERH